MIFASYLFCDLCNIVQLLDRVSLAIFCFLNGTRETVCSTDTILFQETLCYRIFVEFECSCQHCVVFGLTIVAFIDFVRVI
jgi:hypothetical protein